MSAVSARAFDVRIGSLRVRFRAPTDLLCAVVGPLATIEAEAPSEATDVEVVAAFDASLPAASSAPPSPAGITWDPSPTRPAVVADGLGRAEIPERGPVSVRVRPSPPPGDLLAEGLVIPALAERLRREGVRLVHAAVLAHAGARRALLVPAPRGGGKTTLALSLRRHGFAMLSDDRAFLLGEPDAALVDPWPEVPRVGDRSLFLLPPHARPAARSERTGKSEVPALSPPRIREPLPVAGVLFPRLVAGGGGAVRRLHGAEALAKTAPQAVVATDPATASASLAFLASLLARVPAFEVEVGDDPARIAASLEGALT